MLFSKTTESRFAVVFVLAKKHQIEDALNIKSLNILVASWFVYNFILEHKAEIQSVFKEEIDVYKNDIFLPEIIESLKQVQKHGIKLQDETPSGLEKIYLLL